jgi:hypothetical protein
VPVIPDMVRNLNRRFAVQAGLVKKRDLIFRVSNKHEDLNSNTSAASQKSTKYFAVRSNRTIVSIKRTPRR